MAALTGEHRAPRRWSPPGVAFTVGALLLAKAGTFAAAGWLGWWRCGLLAAYLLFQIAVAVLAWGLGYATRDEDAAGRTAGGRSAA